MSLNLSAPTNLNCLLIGGAVSTDGGSTDSTNTLTTNNNGPVSAALEIKSTEGALLLSRMTTAERNTLNADAGMIIYNLDTASYNFRDNNNWITINDGTGNVTGPAESVVNNIAVFGDTSGEIIEDSGISIEEVGDVFGPGESVINNLVIFTDEGGKQIGDSEFSISDLVRGPTDSVENNIAVFGDTVGETVVDSGVSISQVPALLLEGREPSALVDVNELGNLGHIRFTGDAGLIFLGDSSGIQFLDNGDDVGVLITGGIPGSSIASSALLELRSTTGAFVFSRMSSEEMNALSPIEGMTLYNTSEGKTFQYNGSSWISFGGGSILSVVGTAGEIDSTGGDNPVLSLVPTGVTAASYTNPDLTIDELGRVTVASSNTTPTFSSITVSGLTASTLVATDGSKALTSSVSGLSPTFTGLGLSGLTASQAIVTDGSKNLVSMVYASTNTTNSLVIRDAGGDFSAGTITASLNGNALTASNATTATALQTPRAIGGVSFNGTTDIVPQTIQSINESSDTTCFPLFISASGSQSLQPLNNSGFIYNANSNSLTATTFIGALTGNASTATSALILATPRNIGGVSFNGSEDIVPETIKSIPESSDTTCFPLFISASGSQVAQPLNNSGFIYNSSANSLTATTFIGALNGNATTATSATSATSAATLTTPRNIGGVSFNGSADIVPQTIQSVNEASDTTCFPLFISASGSQSLQPLNNTSFTFNASTAALGVAALTLSQAATTPVITFSSGGAGTFLSNSGARVGIVSGGDYFTARNIAYDGTTFTFISGSGTGAGTITRLSNSAFTIGFATGGTAGGTATFTTSLTSNINGISVPKTSLDDGSVGTPALNFTSDTNTGLYRVGTDNLGLVCGGANILDISTNAITATGSSSMAANFTAPGNGVINKISVINSSNTANSGASIVTNVAGTSAADPYFSSEISGGQVYSWGIDNSVTGDPWVLSCNATLGTTNAISVDSSANVSVATGNLSIDTVGKTLKIKQGTNACSGTGSVLVGGTVIVSTSAVATGDTILLTCTTAGGTQGIPRTSISSGVSFTITSSSGTDTSTYSWVILKPA